MNKPVIDPEIQKGLFSIHTEKVIFAIQKIKEEGNKNYLLILFDLLLTTPEPIIEKEILNLLGTVKDKESIPVFINAITDQKYLTIKKLLLASCWQNGLDFSAYLEVFVEIVIEEEWETAFEAFTLIENFEQMPVLENLSSLTEKINHYRSKVSNKKQYFLQEILKLLA